MALKLHNNPHNTQDKNYDKITISDFDTSVSAISVKSITKDSERVQPINFVPYDWLKDAKIYNKKWQQVPNEWIIEKADIIVLLFTARGVDRDGILKKFYHIYESTKYVHIPIEVIFLPMDETEEDAVACFKEQANWFTLRHDDILVQELKFMYGISSIPHISVFKTNCEVISFNGIAELDMYGKNAVISWLSLLPKTKPQRRRSEDAQFYGPMWKFVKQDERLPKYKYHRRFKEEGEMSEENVSTDQRENYTRPQKYSKRPEDRPRPSESKPPKDHPTPSESPAQLPDSRAKSAVTSAQLLESPSQLPEGRSRSAGSVQPVQKPSIIHIKLPDDFSKPSESQHGQLSEDRSTSTLTQIPSRHSLPSETGSRPSKLHVHLPEDDLRQGSQSQLEEKRSKSATHPQTSQSIAKLSEIRSKSAKFADDL